MRSRWSRILRRLVLITAPLLLLGALMAGPSAADQSCTGSPHSASNPGLPYPDVIDVSCDTAISSGTVTIDVNRAGRVARSAHIENGTGSLSCTAQSQPPDAQYPLEITCTGSLSAAATAEIHSSLAPDPCDSPAFAGQLAVAFGDGTSFGPTALAPYACSSQTGSGQPGSGQPGSGQPGSGQPGSGQPGSGQTGSGSGSTPPRKRQRRQIQLIKIDRLGAATARAAGFIRSRDGFARCAMDVPVVIQRRSGRHWLTVGRTKSHSSPNRRGSVGWSVRISLRHGTYRALAAQVRIRGHVCLRAVSRAKHGP